jgi:proline racemase
MLLGIMTSPARKLRAASPAAELPARVQTAGGASAEVDGERLLVRDGRGSIVVVYDAERGTAEILAPAGDLVLGAPHGKILLRAREVECEAGRIELRADRIFERARDVYREVEGLLHTRAERVRTLAHGAYTLFAKRVNVAAEEDAAVDGKRVLLG